MEYVNIHHMHPVKFGKSYFLSRDVIKVSNLITQTIKKKKKFSMKKEISIPNKYLHIKMINIKRK